MSSALTQSEIFALLQDGHTVLLPTAHAARTLRARFAQTSPASPSEVEPGPILAWQEWTASLWSNLVIEGLDERVLLNRAQEVHLWAEIIGSYPAPSDRNSEDVHAQAQMARSALHLAAAYNATERLRSAANTFDSHTFATWLDAFRDHCTRNRLLAPALLEQSLSRHLRGGLVKTSPRLHLAGFEQHTPAQRDLITSLHASGCSVTSSTLQHEHRAETQQLAITAASPSEQFDFAIRWVAQQASQGADSLALILRSPDEHRSELERLLRRYIAPELDAVSTDLSSTPWQFAQGSPLRSFSMVAHTLDLLRWTQHALSTERIGQLLLSPYFGFSEDADTRARFEAAGLRDRQLLRPELDLASFLQLINSSARSKSGQTLHFAGLQALHRVIEQKAFKQGLRSYADWADQVRALLQVVGWPGSRTVSPAEFATAERWDSVLDVLASLNVYGRRITYQHFLASLEREVEQTSLFTPQTTAPLQILTLEESEGISFGATLVLNATAIQLPAPQRPHPLISRRLQADLNMPGADPESAYLRARSALRNLDARSGELHLVAPANDANGPLRFTALAEDLVFQHRQADQVLAPGPSSQPVTLVSAPETPLPPLPSPNVAGGARVLELQARCGFQAFADLRLRASFPEPAKLGIEPREAGNVLHLALHKLWEELKDQATLKARTTSERREAVRQAVGTALRPLRSLPSAQHPWSEAFLAILEARFNRLILRWLDFELERSSFRTVAQEQERHVTVGPLELNVRLDRLDQVEGGLVFVDYKTGSSHSADDWLGPRPDAPQLPLYTLTEDPDQVRGLAFARIRPGKAMGWISRHDGPGLFRGKGNKQELTPEDIESWREHLTELAFAFAEGRVQVNPKTYPQTCEHCAHRLLCRLDPTDMLAQDNDVDEFEQEVVLG